MGERPPPWKSYGQHNSSQWQDQPYQGQPPYPPQRLPDRKHHIKASCPIRARPTSRRISTISNTVSIPGRLREP